MNYIHGVDVASMQPADPNLTGQQFCIVKATEGTSYINPKAAEQAAHARGLGLVVCFYHFLHTGNIAQQAAFFVKNAPSLKGDPLFHDWETDPATGKYATGAEKDQALKDTKALRPHHRVGLYCNTDFWFHHDTTSYAGDGLWIADPNHPAGRPGIRHPWTIQQYGQANGMDQNVANFPTRDAMHAWAVSA
jgi:GH25 family lysozyme M1 (1,4-beta-N-acetylmuramidase)